MKSGRETAVTDLGRIFYRGLGRVGLLTCYESAKTLWLAFPDLNNPRTNLLGIAIIGVCHSAKLLQPE